MQSTPPEINIKVEAWNDARRRDALSDYRLAVLLLNGRNNSKNFPSFEKFYPEAREPNAPSNLEEMKKEGARVGMRVPV
jgi:hypothetical protein